MNAEVYLGLGGNLGTPKETFEKALHLMSDFVIIEKISSLYKSSPFGYTDQPPFINAAVQIKTESPPLELLSQLQIIEKKLGKKVIHTNGPRIIDIDLLVYQEFTLELENLTLPHPGILDRDFVLLPMLDLNPTLTQPAWGSETLKSALSGLQKRLIMDKPEDWDYKI
ncbi:MAG: 2-amino-4-hydroxy-6-hydroxymethyldihydropteridine diphosphokinase [Opitutae bacterium]|nr:2-amino-4-hydroxy-6-hydroxymethyldihydropteridine diphosphokinase [Opitutae bacterium]